MTPHDLLAAFDVLAEAPRGVQRLRALVLELAVRGKLVPQDPNDEPASVLLERIAAEKAQLVKAGKLRASKPLPSVSNDETPFDVPAGWEWVRFDQVLLDIQAGWSPSCQARPKEGLEWGVLKVSACSWGRFLPDENKALLPGVEPKPELEVRSGDFLISRANTAELVARSVVVAECPPRLILSDKTLRLCPSSDVNVRFLNLANLSTSSRAHYESQASGTSDSMRNVSQAAIRSALLPLPPRHEQQRIVARLDAVMALLDRLEAARVARETARLALRDAALTALRDAPDAAAVEVAWARVAEHLDDLLTAPADVAPLRQTILQLAVRGKLVPQDPRDEPASVLLERITAEKTRQVKQSKLKKLEPQPPVGADEVLHEVPERWRYCRLAEVTDIVGGVAKGRKLEGRKAGTFPYLRVANVQAGFLDLSVIKTIELPLDEFDRYKLTPGDVLLTEGGDWDKLGRSAIWAGEIEECIHQNHVFRARCLHPGLMPRWVSMFTNSPDGRAYFQSCSKQTTNLASINMTQLRNCPLPVPPTAEQHRIVAKVDELMALCDTLEARLRAVHDAQAAFAAAAVHHLDT